MFKCNQPIFFTLMKYYKFLAYNQYDWGKNYIEKMNHNKFLRFKFLCHHFLTIIIQKCFFSVIRITLGDFLF